MKTMLIGGPGHLLEVEADAGSQTYEHRTEEERHHYIRRLCLDVDGRSVRAYFVHPDLSPGEAEALMLMQTHQG